MDPSKFFNRKINIRNPKTPYGKGKFIDESQNYSSRISSRINQSPLTKSLFSIRNKIFQIENILVDLSSLDKKKQEQNKKIKAAKVPDKKPKTRGPQIFGKLIQRPKTGALHLIRDFVTFTFLGWLFTRIQPLLGGLTKLKPLLDGAAWFIGGTIKNMIDIFATFLKLGFDAKEKFDGLIKGIKDNAEGINKTFDDTLTALKGVFGGTIELANSFLNVSVKEDELNEAKTVLAKEETVENFPPLPPLPSVDEPRMPETFGAFSPTTTIQKLNTGGIVRGYNEGGRIDPRTPVTRGVETQRREVPKPRPTIQPQKTAPGKDVGGDKKIKQLYDQTSASSIADFIPLPSFFRSDKKSGFAALMGASEEYKKPLSDDIIGVGNLMGAAVDSALGQKIEKKSYTQFADGIRYLVDYSKNEPEKFSKINLEEMIRKIVEPRVNMAINKIQSEINKKSLTEDSDEEPSESDPGVNITGGNADFWTLVAVASREDSDPQGQADVAQSIYNRLLAIKNGANFNQKDNTIKGIILARMGYEPTWRYPNGATSGAGNPNPEWLSIVDAESAAKASGFSVQTIKKVAGNILNTNKQESAREFIQGRTDFKAQGQGVTGISRSSRGNVFGWHYGYKKNKIASVPQFGAKASPSFGGSGSSAAIAKAAEELRGMSSAEGPAGGREACVWAVNKVYAKAGIRPPWGDRNWVPYAEESMLKAGYRQVSYSKRHAGDIMVMYDKQSPPQAHIGVVLSNGKVLSNSTTNARFSWEATPEQYNKRYGGVGKIYRMPSITTDNVARQPSQSSTDNTAKEVKMRNEQNYKFAMDKIQNMEPDSEPLIFPGVGIVTLKRNEQGTLVKKYYLNDGKTEIDITTFNKKLRDSMVDSSQALRRKHGGLVYKNGQPIILPDEKYQSYGDMQSTQIAIQPLIINNPIPVPVSSGVVPFAVPIISNSTSQLT